MSERKTPTARRGAERVWPVPDEDRRRFPPEVRRAMILETAKEVLLPDPDATLKDVARAAGVTTQLIRLYFGGGGTGPLYAAMFDQYLERLPDLLGEELDANGLGNRQVREVTQGIVARYLDWAEEIGQAWVFGETRGRPGTGIAERWEVTFEHTADVLLKARGPTRNPEQVRAAVMAAMTSFNTITQRMLIGKLNRPDAEKVLVEVFASLYSTVIPALEKD